MQKFLHYNKWIGNITGHDLTKSDYCISILSEEINNKNLRDYIVYKNELIKKDHIVRTSNEKQFTNIKCNDGRSIVTLTVFPDDAIIKVVIDKDLLQQYIDPYQFDNIQFTEPILKIYIHSKKSPELLGTLEIDLNEYFKTGKYEQDISVILSKVKITDLVFKTQRCFEKYAYEILESDKIKTKKVDRNLIDNNIHLEIIRFSEWDLLVRNHIRYWQEFDSVLNDKITIFFTDKKNRNKLEFYFSFTLLDIQTNKFLKVKLPSILNFKNSKIHCNKKQLKIHYENTDH